MQYWSPNNPCEICGAMSNTSHLDTCSNAYLYDAAGHAIPAVETRESEASMSLDIKRYRRVPFVVSAVKVTEENMAEVASWCGGEVLVLTKKIEGVDTDVSYIKVKSQRPYNERQTKAFVDDSVTLSETGGFKVFTPTAFENGFEVISEEEREAGYARMNELRENPGAVLPIDRATGDISDPFAIVEDVANTSAELVGAKATEFLQGAPQEILDKLKGQNEDAS